MALLTPVSLADAQRLGALYGLQVAAARAVLAGSVNTNVALEMPDGSRAFLRVYEEQTRATAAGEAALLEHMASCGVLTPRPLSRIDRSGFIAEHAGKPVALFPWVDGEILCQKRITPDVASQVGEALARVHTAGASFGHAVRSRFGLAELSRRIRSLRASALPPELRADVERLAARLVTTRERTDAGFSLVHGDLFRDNVLWSEGRIAALLDFESAALESPVFDLMVTVLSWCFGDELELELAGAMMRAYARVRPLSDLEASRLHEDASFAALRFAITRITDFELRPRGTGVYKDYRRFLARAAAVDHLGQPGLVALLR